MPRVYKRKNSGSILPRDLLASSGRPVGEDVIRRFHIINYGDLWRHNALTMWRDCHPIMHPHPEGLMDDQGRPLPDPEKPNPFHMKPGSAYMTRALLREAWDRSVPLDMRGGYDDANHRADSLISTLLKKRPHRWTILHRYGHDQFFYDLDWLASFTDNPYESFIAEHLGREHRWRGFGKKEVKVGWEAVYDMVSHDLVTDFDMIKTVADSLDIATHGGTSISQKINAWGKEARIAYNPHTRERRTVERARRMYPIAYGLYKIARWDDPYLLPEPQNQNVLLNWKYEFFYRYAPIQFERDERSKASGEFNPLDNTFTYEHVLAEFEDDRYKSIDVRGVIWNDVHRPARFDRGYINNILYQSSVTPEQLKPEDTQTLFVRYKTGDKFRYRLNEAAMALWFGDHLHYTRPRLRARVLRWIAARQERTDPFWFTTHDMDFIIREAMGGPLKGYGPELLKLLLKKQDIVFLRDAHKAAWAINKNSLHYRDCKIYILSNRAAEQFGQPYPEGFDAAHYEVPIDSEFVPVREPPSWGSDPNFLERMTSVFDSYYPEMIDA